MLLEGTSSGKFYVKSAYLQLNDNMSDIDGEDWKVVWKWSGPERVKTFLWLCFKEKLLTNVERERRHMAAGRICRWCNNGDEDVLHILRDCLSAQEAWGSLLRCDIKPEFMEGNLQQWL